MGSRQARKNSESMLESILWKGLLEEDCSLSLAHCTSVHDCRPLLSNVSADVAREVLLGRRGTGLGASLEGFRSTKAEGHRGSDSGSSGKTDDVSKRQRCSPPGRDVRYKSPWRGAAQSIIKVKIYDGIRCKSADLAD
jgi:hypothetical protein